MPSFLCSVLPREIQLEITHTAGLEKAKRLQSRVLGQRWHWGEGRVKPALGTARGEKQAQGCAHLSALCVHGGCQGSARWHRAGLEPASWA